MSSLLVRYFVLFALLSAVTIDASRNRIITKNHFRKSYFTTLPHSLTKRQSCESANLTICNEQLNEISPYEYENNITEFTRRINEYTAILCAEPCFSAHQSYYKCVELPEAASFFEDIECLQVDGEFCGPKFEIDFVTQEESDNSRMNTWSVCGNYTSPDCSTECREETQEIFDPFGCCGIVTYQNLGNVSNDTETQSLVKNILSCLMGDVYECSSAPSISVLPNNTEISPNHTESMASNITCLGDVYDCDSAAPGISGMGPLGLLAMVVVTIMTISNYVF